MTKQNTKDKYSELCGYLDAMVDVNLKENIIHDYSFFLLDGATDWYQSLCAHLDFLSAGDWFSTWEVSSRTELECSVEVLTACLHDWFFVFLGTGGEFGGSSKSGFRALDTSFLISMADGQEVFSKKFAERLLAFTEPHQVFRVEVETDKPQYIFGYCFVLVGEQGSWWLRLGAAY